MNRKIFFATCVSLFYVLTSFAQLHVDEDQDVGIGVGDTGDSKTKIENSTNLSTLELKGTYNGIGEKYGVKNYVEDIDVNGNNLLYGSHNELVNKGSGVSYGGLFAINADGTGYKYGCVSSVYQNVNSSSTIIGLSSSIYPKSNLSTTNYGIYNYVSPDVNFVGTNIGVKHVVVNKGSGASYGIIADINGSSGWAGRFIGDVQIIGMLDISSDEKLKREIRDLGECTTILEKIKPRRYKVKVEYDRGETEKEHFGFIAQELEVALPNLVRTIPALPSDSQLDGSETTSSESYKAINYIELIPFMMQALKEQQTQIETQQSQIEKQQEMIDRLIKEVEKISKK